MNKIFIVLFTIGISFISSYGHASISEDSHDVQLKNLESALFKKQSCTEVIEVIENISIALRHLPQREGVLKRHERRLIETYAIIRKCGLNIVAPEDVLEGQLEGMVGALKDPHSEFLNLSRVKEYQQDYNGYFIGLGISMEPILEGGVFTGVKIVSLIPSSPAEKAGLLANDKIIEISEEGKMSRHISTFKSMSEFSDTLSGVMGSTVTITLVRENMLKPLVARVVRSQISVSMISGEVLPTGWIWIKASEFSGKNFCNELAAKHSALRNKAGKNFRGTLLDLQNNPGGFLDSAICTVSLFATDNQNGNSIVLQEDRSGISELGKVVNAKNLGGGKPLVVLVNPGSASASEIVAKAIQYYGLGEVVGTPTYGKGSLQYIIQLSDGDVALKLTTAQYFVGLASGPVTVQKVGVTPNLLMYNPRDAEREFTSERDLPGSIEPSKAARDQVIVQTKESNHKLYDEIVDLLSRKPFEFTLKK